MWIKRQDWEQQIIALSLAKADAQADVRLAQLRETSLQEQVAALQIRVKELQGQLAELSTQLVMASSVIQPPITEADWFEEDEEEVRKDRLRIEEEGTSDGLLSESD